MYRLENTESYEVEKYRAIQILFEILMEQGSPLWRHFNEHFADCEECRLELKKLIENIPLAKLLKGEDSN